MTRPVNVFDPNYFTLLTIWDAQQRAGADNALALANWPGIAKNWQLKAQQDVAIGKLPDPPPAPPLATMVADDGTVSHVKFEGLSTPVLPVAVLTPNTGGLRPPGGAVAPDRTDQMILMLHAIAAKLGIPGA